MTDQQPPIRLEVDPRPGAPRSAYDRRSIILRPVLILPVYFLLTMFVSPWFSGIDAPFDWVWLVLTGFAPGLLGALTLATGAMIAFRGRYPRWWFETHAEIVRFGVRVLAYALLLTDRYPSTDTETDVRLLIEAPPVDTLRDRRLAFFKPLLALPHVLLWCVAAAAVAWAAVVVWIAALLGKRLPRWHRDLVIEVLEYGFAIYAFGFLHLTDRYPRFGDTALPR